MRRPAAVAGMFYPGEPEALRSQIDGFLANAGPPKVPPPKALIAPHAGTVYSGPVAASAYVTLGAGVERVVLIGPAHRVFVQGLAVPTVEAFSSPLGEIPLDRATIDHLVARFPQVVADDRAHAKEHSLEVHLPFLQRTVNMFQLVPLVVGRASADEVEAVLDEVWGGPETLVVCSTDLSHFHPYDEARRIDEETVGLIEAQRGERLDGERACGYVGLRGLLQLARRRGMGVQRLDVRNSGDTAGDRSRVVGYASFALTGEP